MNPDKKQTIFYGWFIVGASLLLLSYNSGMFIYGFTAFINPISATFGWSYAQILLAGSFRAIEGDLLNPLIGMLVDRWPARRLMLIGISILGVGILLLSQSKNIIFFYASYLVVGLGGSISIFMVPQVTIARWFKKNIGKASAIMFMGMGIGGTLIPVITKMIDSLGWQNVFIILAIGIWVLGTLLSFIFRTRPEEYGLLPDGEQRATQGEGKRQEEAASGLGVKEALKTRIFWQLGIAGLVQLGTMQAAIYHIMPYLDSLGVERTNASMVAMLMPLISLAGRIPFGWSADIFTKKYVAALSLFMQSLGLFVFSLINADSYPLMITYAVIAGLSMGGMLPLRIALIREYFGVRRFGTIMGLQNMFTSTSMIIGPPLVGWIYDTQGSYGSIWIIYSAAAMFGVINLLTLPTIQKKEKI